MAEKQEEEKELTKIQAIEMQYPDQMNTYYSNRVQLFISNSDITFDFALVEPKLKGKTSTVATVFQTRIIMSPQHAKQFSTVLSGNIRKYEETFGPINIEPIKK